MLVKCKCHGNMINRDDAYKVRIGDTNQYYCSKSDYDKIVEERNSKDSAYESIYNLFGRKVTNTALYKEIGELATVYSYRLIKEYIDSNSDKLEFFIHKDFSSEYTKIRYFAAILKNSLHEFKSVTKKLDIPQNTNVEIIEEPKYQQRSKRRALSDYMDGDDE